MKLVVGLGNPGPRYASTRHNIGFGVLEALAGRLGLQLGEERFGGRFASGHLGAEPVGLLQPLTWMNRSGEAVERAVRELGIEDPADVLVVHDDLDLPLGRLRLRPRGSDGGHNGLADVLRRLGTRDVPRLRVGVGRPPDGGSTIDWVLEGFDDAEWPEVEAVLERAAEAVACFVTEGSAAAMDRFNAAVPARPGAAAGGASGGEPGESLQSGSNRADPSKTMAEPVSSPDASRTRPPSGPETVTSESQASSPRRPRLADRLASPFVRFMQLEISSAIMLLAMAALALAWANSPWAASYEALWNTPVAFTVGSLFHLELPLELWVNDGLMTIFFFVVGMEIKREMVSGELSTRSRAMLPFLGAVGGMVVPAGIYAWLHWGGPAMRGWGVPMATDIAFAVAALSVMGSRVPGSLRVFLLALAIADDLGAVAVIAIFYTAEIHLEALAWAGGGLAFCALLNWVGVRNLLVYLLLGLFVWYETHHSGVHATIAGVMLGFITPTTLPADDRESLIDNARRALDRLVDAVSHGPEGDQHGHHRHEAARSLRRVGELSLSPLDFLVNGLERWVAFFIMPAFALANAGVVLDPSMLGDPIAQRVMVGVAAGLLIGKPLGITLFSWLAVKTRIAELPTGVGWGAIMATGVLAGIGFTVALFVTALAFTDPVHAAGSKVGILVGSAVATVLGLVVLHYSLPPAAPKGPPR